MNVVGRVGSLISQGVYSVATPFHPFGGAVDVIVVQQQDGTFRSTPWYVRFGKFQGVLKGTEKIVRINVNGVEAGFHMYLDNSGEAFFLREADSSKECEVKDSDCVGVTEDGCNVYVDGNKEYGGNEVVEVPRLEHTMSDSAMVHQLREESHSTYKRQLERSESEGDRRFYEIQNEDSVLDSQCEAESQASDSEVILVSVDGHVLTAPVSGSEEDAENVQLNTPQFHLGPGEGPDFVEESEELSGGDAWAADYISKMSASKVSSDTHNVCNNPQDDTNALGNQIEACEEGDQVHRAQETQNVVNEDLAILTPRSVEADTHNNCSRTEDDSDSRGNKIEACEDEGKRVHQAQETQNDVNQDADILTQGSVEADTHTVYDSSNDDTNATCNKIEACEDKGEQVHQARETQNIVNQDADIVPQGSAEPDIKNVYSSSKDDTNATGNKTGACEDEGEQVHHAPETQNDVNPDADIVTQGSTEADIHNVYSSSTDDTSATSNKIEDCEDKGEQVHQAEETQNVVNQDIDNLTQRSEEADTPNVYRSTKDDNNAIGNKIGACEDEEEQVHQSEETQNVVNQDVDILTQRSAEADTHTVYSRTKDDTDAIGNKIEVCEGKSDQVHQAQGTQTVGNRETYLLTQKSAQELDAIKRAEVFRSCVELPALVTKVQITRKLQEKSEDRGVTEFRKNDELSPSSGYNSPGDSASPELHTAIGPVPVTAFGRIHDSDSTSSHSGYNESEWKDGQLGMPASVQGINNALERSPTQGESSETVESQPVYSCEGSQSHSRIRFEISLCGSELRPGMGLNAAAESFDAHRVSRKEFQNSAESITKNENLIVRFGERYLTWQKAAPFVLGMAAFGLELPVEVQDEIPIKEALTGKSKDDDSDSNPSSSRRWRLWPIPFRRVKTLEHTSSHSSNEDIFVDSVSGLQATHGELYPMSPGGDESPLKQFIRTNVPTNEQIASLNLKEGQNMITFSFSTRVLGMQQVDAHIYLWMWNARIVISDVDGTITKSDVLGQFMPLVGKDWSQSGVAQLFSAIKENGYQLLFLSARAIVQAYLTRSFLLNLKQDGKALPNGPVVISPDGLFPSLFREVIRRAPHEFKIACLEDIKKLFPSDYNPFYAGFGNRDTDELSYRKIGIPKGKIFIINPKGEVAISRHRIDVKSYTSLHTLVNDMFPPTSLVEQEDFNNWNYWRMPLPEVDI